MKTHLALLAFLFSTCIFAQQETLVLKTKTGTLEGTLLVPQNQINIPLVLIIAGSGPTDRDGNNDAMKNNSLKFLAEELQKNNIASFRFDKRGVGQSSDAIKDEAEMRPETYVQDIREWILLLSKDTRFSKLIVAGHSEGSLFGMLAAQNNPRVSGYISISGAGRPIDEILKEQFSEVVPDVRKNIYSMLDMLKKGDTISNVPPIFYSIFRPSIQPYMISWMKYNPQTEIKKLSIPILITTGTTDIQVKILDSEMLLKGNPRSELRIVKNMNHVLKQCDTLDKESQMLMYNDPEIPLHAEFSANIVNFINEHFIAKKPGSELMKKN